MKRAYLIPFAVFVAIAVLLSKGLHLHPAEVKSPLIGKPVPNFSLQDLNQPGRTMTQDDLKGHVSLLNVWASWCTTCLAEHPYIKDFSNYPDVQFYSLNYKDTEDNAIQWLKKSGNPYMSIGFDVEGLVGMDFGVYGTPEAFLIDKKGIIRYKYVGMIDEQIWGDEFLPRIKLLVTS